MKPFKRRTYSNLREMTKDLLWPFRHRSKVKQAMHGELVSLQFRERLMMVVTAVNECRYCAYYHARESERAGLAPDVIREMLAGDLTNAPEEELPALLFAQHYAESNGRPNHHNRQSLQTTYGPERANAIEIVLRLIRMGNLMGNSTDWLLYKLSFGRLGDE